MRFRVHLTDGTKVETDDAPERIQEKHRGRIAKIKKLKGESSPVNRIGRHDGLAHFTGRAMRADDARGVE